MAELAAELPSIRAAVVPKSLRISSHPRHPMKTTCSTLPHFCRARRRGANPCSQPARDRAPLTPRKRARRFLPMFTASSSSTPAASFTAVFGARCLMTANFITTLRTNLPEDPNAGQRGGGFGPGRRRNVGPGRWNPIGPVDSVVMDTRPSFRRRPHAVD